MTSDLWFPQVDVDLRLRACGGACASTQAFSVDRSVYETLQERDPRRGVTLFDHIVQNHVVLEETDGGILDTWQV